MNNLHRQILRLAWPAIATNITTPLLALIDVAIVGHIDGGNLIAAVAVGGTLFNILYWLFAFLRMGTSGMTAQAYGSLNKTEQLLVLLRGCFIAITGGLLLYVLAPLVGPHVIRLIDSGPTSQTALQYFNIVILGAPGVLMTFVVSGWLLGMQRSKPIMWIALATNLLNIGLSCVFVFMFKLGLTGVALGTAISQLVGALIGISVVIKVLHKTQPTRTENSGWWKNNLQPIFEPNAWKSMFRINTDIFFRTLCLATVTLWFTHEGARMGTDILAANSLLMQLFLVFSYFMDGFAFGGEALAGRYFGARDFKTLNYTVKALFLWGIITSLIFTVLYFFAGDLFLSILTDDTHVVGAASDFKIWAITVPLTGFAAFTWDGILIGMTRTRYLLASMAIAMAIFFGLYYGGLELSTHCTFAPGFIISHPNHILWFAFVIYLFSRGVVSTILYRKFISRIDKTQPST